jgi:hypothetical protein
MITAGPLQWGQVSDEGDPSCDWVHAYLHRKEGDAANAAYWYRRAAKPVAKGALAEEWRSIVAALTHRS